MFNLTTMKRYHGFAVPGKQRFWAISAWDALLEQILADYQRERRVDLSAPLSTVLHVGLESGKVVEGARDTTADDGRKNGRRVQPNARGSARVS